MGLCICARCMVARSLLCHRKLMSDHSESSGASLFAILHAVAVHLDQLLSLWQLWCHLDAIVACVIMSLSQLATFIHRRDLLCPVQYDLVPHPSFMTQQVALTLCLLSTHHHPTPQALIVGPLWRPDRALLALLAFLFTLVRDYTGTGHVPVPAPCHLHAVRGGLDCIAPPVRQIKRVMRLCAGVWQAGGEAGHGPAQRSVLPSAMESSCPC